MLMLLFAVTLGVLPSSGYGTWQRYVLPVTTLALFSSASLAALTRANNGQCAAKRLRENGAKPGFA